MEWMRSLSEPRVQEINLRAKKREKYFTRSVKSIDPTVKILSPEMRNEGEVFRFF